MVRMAELIEQIAKDRGERSICKPPERWTDNDTGDEYEAAVTKDGEWVVITRASRARCDVVRFEIPIEVFHGCARHLGWTVR